MGFTCEIDPVRRLATIRLSGAVTGETLVAALRAMAADPAWQPGFSRLWDFREASMLDITGGDIEQIRQELSDASYRATRTACLVQGAVEDAVSFLIGVKVRGWPIQVFWSHEQAQAWLADG